MAKIAIDGPAGAGKSTLARQLVARLGFLYVDTGAIYRTVALSALREGLDCRAEADLSPALGRHSLEMRYGADGQQRMLLDGEDVSEEIRTPEVSQAASHVAALPCVRAYLLEYQRDLARRQDVVMDGRDIGTVVLPDAEVKIFLTASARERARRRHLELLQRGSEVPYEEVLRDVEQRDLQDSTRAEAPLRQAEDAVLLDTSALGLEESLAALLRIVKERLA